MVPYVNSLGVALPAYRQAGVAALFGSPSKGSPTFLTPPSHGRREN